MSTTFHVGDRVRIIRGIGRGTITGVITEDRGVLGPRRHLYSVLVYQDPFEPVAYELPEDELEAFDESYEEHVKLEKEKIIEYLKNGGLIMMLQSNLSGGRGQPQVWIRLDTLGNLTHTFIKERGRVGGGTVPFLATDGDKVFTPKKDEVVTFLQTFGLSRREAEDVISSVGTSPS